jgi:hypothetical protein
VLRFGGSDVKRFLAFESRVAPPRERGSKAFLFCREEIDLFNRIGVKFVEPEFRNL